MANQDTAYIRPGRDPRQGTVLVEMERADTQVFRPVASIQDPDIAWVHAVLDADLEDKANDAISQRDWQAARRWAAALNLE